MARDLTGLVFGRLTVIDRAEDYVTPSGYKTPMWNCVCTCGNTTTVRGKSLTCGVTRSCGCLVRDTMSRISKKHGYSGTRLYAIWDSMRQRCYNENSQAYHNYGARGISVCAEWDDFGRFKDWAEQNGYETDAERGVYTLDRIDVNSDYTPENCRWATEREQANNRRDTIRLTYLGDTHTLAEWSDIVGIKYCTLWKRYKRGESADQILSKPV